MLAKAHYYKALIKSQCIIAKQLLRIQFNSADQQSADPIIVRQKFCKLLEFSEHARSERANTVATTVPRPDAATAGSAKG